VSLGPQEYALTARFPNGVPAVCDVNMSEWMQYLYAEFARPADVVGVEAVLRVLDPNNYFCEVGRTTSDASGMLSCAFTPEVSGKYAIIASFAGSKSYYGSFSETAVYVQRAPTATPESEQPQAAPDYTLLIAGTGIAMILAVAMVGLILFRIRP